MRLKTLIVGAIVSASMMLAAPALAQTASQQGYATPSGSIEERISTENPRTPNDPPTVATREEARSELPFTGRDIGLIVAAGGVLLAMGFGMRRLSRPEVA
ncbi:MAG TPA: hypothetical protein VF712_03060 [Thermoleophilaceae bacterium]|jgi:hypothetical protein